MHFLLPGFLVLTSVAILLKRRQAGLALPALPAEGLRSPVPAAIPNRKRATVSGCPFQPRSFPDINSGSLITGYYGTQRRSEALRFLLHALLFERAVEDQRAQAGHGAGAGR